MKTYLLLLPVLFLMTYSATGQKNKKKKSSKPSVVFSMSIKFKTVKNDLTTDTLTSVAFHLVFGKSSLQSDKSGTVYFTDKAYNLYKNKTCSVMIPSMSDIFYNHDHLLLVNSSGEKITLDLSVLTLERVRNMLSTHPGFILIFKKKENATNTMSTSETGK